MGLFGIKMMPAEGKFEPSDVGQCFVLLFQSIALNTEKDV
jgi:hypothetical protein